jgi:hypothetical protein
MNTLRFVLDTAKSMYDCQQRLQGRKANPESAWRRNQTPVPQPG